MALLGSLLIIFSLFKKNFVFFFIDFVQLIDSSDFEFQVLSIFVFGVCMCVCLLGSIELNCAFSFNYALNSNRWTISMKCKGAQKTWNDFFVFALFLRRSFVMSAHFVFLIGGYLINSENDTRTTLFNSEARNDLSVIEIQQISIDGF